MFARWQQRLLVLPKQRAQVRRRDELHAERGLICREQPRLQGVRMSACRHNDQNGPRMLPRLAADVRKPIRNPALPGRVGRRREEQSGTAFCLKIELQLHLLTLAERADKSCPTFAKT